MLALLNDLAHRLGLIRKPEDALDRIRIPSVAMCDVCGYTITIMSPERQVIIDRNGLGPGDALVTYRPFTGGRELQRHGKDTICSSCLEWEADDEI